MRIYPYQPCDTLRTVIFHSKWLFFCCPVDGGLTYRPPNAKIYGPGNFGGSGVQPQLTRDKIPFYMLSKNSINRYSDMSDFIQSNNETTPEKAFIKEVMGTGD
ncbi:hypothetical protein ACMG4D_26400 (plasmid) [Escherichia coli]|uniref:hypothetical protein n=1 Tax=Enterobacteriaceae TaxID=543 RepID=UPI001CB76ECB|nr:MULTISPECIES: hypothetical protein [Enterobacteriaceae]